MNTANTISSENNQSFFKLPLIFIGVFFVIYLSVMQIMTFFMRDMPIEFMLQMFTTIFLSMLLPLLLFFISATFCCQKYKLHSVANSWLKVSLIAVIFAILYLGWATLYSSMLVLLMNNMREHLYASEIELWVMLFSYSMRIISYVVFILVLNFLFYLMAKNRSGTNNVAERTEFKLEGIIGSRIHAFAYIY